MSEVPEFASTKELIETLHCPDTTGQLWVADSTEAFLASGFGIDRALAERFDCDIRETGQPITSYSFGSAGEVAVKNYLRKFSAAPTRVFSSFELEPERVVAKHFIPGVAVGTTSKAVETAFRYNRLEGVEARRRVIKLGRKLVGSSNGKVVNNPFHEAPKAGFSDVNLRDSAMRRGLRAGHFSTI